MKWFSRQSQWHGACLLSSTPPWFANDWPRGVIEACDWLTAVDEAGSFQLRLSRLAKSWRWSVQVKRKSDTKNTYPGRKREVRWERTVRWNLIVRQNFQREVFEWVKKCNTFSFLEESTVVSTILWLPGTLCTASNLDSCVFSSEPSTKNESIQTR